MPSAIWEIFSEFLILRKLFHEFLIEWNNSKIWEMREIFPIMQEKTCNNYFTVKCLLKSNTARVILPSHWLQQAFIIWFKANLVEAKTAKTSLPAYISICICQYQYFVLCLFVLYSMYFWNRLLFECFVPDIPLLLKARTYLLSCRFRRVDILYIKFRFHETFTVTNSVTRILLIETQCWFTLNLHMSAFG